MGKFLVLAQETVSTNHVVYWFNQGFAVLVVIALGWAIYGWIRWAGVHLGVPLLKAHTSYLDASTEGIKQATDGIKIVLANQAQQQTEIKQIATSVVALEKTTLEIASDVDVLKSQRQT